MIKNKKVPPSLLGIAGRAGSGKDLVGKIIQYLCLEKKLKIIEPFEKSPQELLEKYGDWKIKKICRGIKTDNLFVIRMFYGRIRRQRFQRKRIRGRMVVLGNNLVSRIYYIILLP